MSSLELFASIRQKWIQRVSSSMARGTDVRENFKDELDPFFEAIQQSIATGDPAWLDPILIRWTSAQTQTELEENQNSLTNLLNKMIRITDEVVREELAIKDAMVLLNELVPIYTYWMEKAVRLEMEVRIAYISKKLEVMQNELEQLDKTKSNFISVAAHELKTPLTLIEGYTTMMREMIDTSGQTQLDGLVDGMNKGVHRLREIIDDMIDVSVIDNNLLSLSFQQTWLSLILGLLKNELEPLLDERKIKLDIKKFPGSDLRIYADQERIYQAVRNLLTNAIKYTPDKGKITVDGRILPGFIEMTVTDTGIGIALEHQTAIFEKFAQLGKPNLHSSSKSKFKGGGPGLGLPITRGIIEAHGGTIWVDSDGYDEEKLPGSTFHVLFPIRTEPGDPKIDKLMNRRSFTEEPYGEENP